MQNTLRNIVIGLGVAGFILAALTVLLLDKSAYGWQANSVPTGSMRPAMPPGSLAVTHRVPLSSLRVGDVITHTNPLSTKTTISHRIIKIYKAHGKIPVYVTKGDANPSADPGVVGGMVQGRVVWHVPHIGLLFMWAKTWVGLAVLVYLPALLIMIHETRLLAAYLRQMKPYRLEGWTHLQLATSKTEPDPRPKWAVAAGSAFVLVLSVTGWQMAAALAPPQHSAALLDIPKNVVATKADPSAAPQTVTAKPGAPQSSSAAGNNTSNGSAAAENADTGSTGGKDTSGNAETNTQVNNSVAPPHVRHSHDLNTGN